MIANFISNPTTKNPSTCCLSLILFQTSKFSFQIANLTLQIPDRLQHLDAIYGCLPAQSRLRSSQHKGINRRGELLLLCFSQPHVIRVHYHDERIPLLGEHSLADDASAGSHLLRRRGESSTAGGFPSAGDWRTRKGVAPQLTTNN